MNENDYSDTKFDDPIDGWIHLRIKKPKDVDTLYQKTRDFTAHEDGLINQRLVWMLTFNGFLFTAYALSLTAEATATINENLRTIEVIYQLRDSLTVAGFASAFIAAIGVLGALKAIRSAAYHYNYAMWRNNLRPFYPRVIGRRRTNVLGMICAVSTPFVVSGPWLYLFLKNREFTNGICSFSQGQTSATFSLIVSLSFVIVFSAITIFPELPDPFKEEKDTNDKNRQTAVLVFAQLVIFTAASVLFVEVLNPAIQVNCLGLFDKFLTISGLVFPTFSIMLFAWLLATSPFRKSFNLKETHLTESLESED